MPLSFFARGAHFQFPKPARQRFVDPPMLTANLPGPTPGNFDALDNEELFRILENLPMALGVAEPVLPDGTIPPDASVTFYNKKWRDLFGFGTDEVKNVTRATERLYPDPGCGGATSRGGKPWRRARGKPAGR